MEELGRLFGIQQGFLPGYPFLWLPSRKGHDNCVVTSKGCFLTPVSQKVENKWLIRSKHLNTEWKKSDDGE